MTIDHAKVIRNFVEPKVAYHGFKYDEEESNPLLGCCFFTRNYWCKKQFIAFSRVIFRPDDLADLVEDDLLSEVPSAKVKPESRELLWLSNRYIEASINGMPIIRGQSLFGRTFNRQLLQQPVDPETRRKNWRRLWWEYRTEVELRQVLYEIVEEVLSTTLSK